MTVSARVVVGVAALTTTLLLAWQVARRSADHVVAAGFWFDGVTFEAPALAAAAGGPLSAAERATVESLARAELAAAFAGLRLDVTAARTAHYRVRVVQAFPPRQAIRGMAVAESRVLGALGGEGAIDFATLAALAVRFAPPGTSRADLVAAIGRGIGRVAAHELAHQILPRGNLHATTDEASYDFGSIDRAGQFYGPMHWHLAGPRLRDVLGVWAAPAR